jgi:DHA2 family multidrug resistance protein
VARSLTTLVLFRVIQGFGAGALQPTEQAILRQTFPPKEQGMAMALFAMAVMIGPAVGPTLGGYIVDHYDWPWIFYINLPVGLLGLFMVSRFVHEPEDILAANRAAAAEQRRNMDWAGIALLSVGLCTLQYVLEEGNSKDWFDSRVILVCTVLSVFSLIGFVIRELTAKVPVVNLSLFKDKAFLSGTMVGSVMFAMLMAVTFLLPLFMQELLGFTAMQSGLALMPRTLIMMVVTPVVGRIYNKISPRLVVGFGILLYAVGAYQMSHYTLETSASGVVSALLIQGVGFSCLFVPLTTVALASIPRYKMTDATGMNSLFRQVGGSIGLAVFANYLSTWNANARNSIIAHLAPVRPEVTARLAQMKAGMLARGYDAATAQTASLGALYGNVMKQATVLTFEKMFLMSGILFVCILPLLLFLKPPEEITVTKPAEVHVEI